MNAQTGRALWRCLHAFAFTFAESPSEADKRRALDWLSYFDEIVSEAEGKQCNCGQHWRAIRARFPVRLESRDAFFRWTVLVHNEVNMRLGKGFVTLE